MLTRRAPDDARVVQPARRGCGAGRLQGAGRWAQTGRSVLHGEATARARASHFRAFRFALVHLNQTFDFGGAPS